MGIGLIKIDTEKMLKSDEQEFIFKISTTEHILHYEELLIGEEELKEYLKKNPFPKDKYYNEETFLRDLQSEGYVCAIVEKRDTAEYIADLFGELV